MATTVNQLRSWFDRGSAKKAEFMIVVCDTFDWSDYPVFCKMNDFEEKYAKFAGLNMQKIMEVYDLSMDREEQLAERRSFHYPPSFASKLCNYLNDHGI